MHLPVDMDSCIPSQGRKTAWTNKLLITNKNLHLVIIFKDKKPIIYNRYLSNRIGYLRGDHINEIKIDHRFGITSGFLRYIC
jgi:hypothetical protein